MQRILKFRTPALFCAFAVLACELIAHPFTTMGVCDDGPYILMAKTLATTGHIVYNGWAAAMIVLQLYLGAAFIKLFGFSFTVVRMSTLLTSLLTAFLLQRTLVRASVTERNATIGTLALVLSPLYLLLSVTFMSDIAGLFAIVLCLYGCLNALQASTSRAAIGWLAFAVATNAICGTCRQIAWLGTLVMVPSALWLLRTRRRVFFSGAVINIGGALFIFGCMHWLKHQPYLVTVNPFVKRTLPVSHILAEFIEAAADIPFLLLPVLAIFLPVVRNRRLRIPIVVFSIASACLLISFYFAKFHFNRFLEPAMGDWVNIYGVVNESGAKGQLPLFLYPAIRVLLTIASIGGLLSLLISLLRAPRKPRAECPSSAVSWKQMGTLLVPFVIAYTIFLLPLAITQGISDRYLLGLLPVALPLVVRFYQERIHPQVPKTAVLFVAIMAFYGITVNHNTFALYRGRAALAAELSERGVPDTSFDNGWEYNIETELNHADHINDHLIATPANAYVRTVPLPQGTCPLLFYDYTPHVKPIYAASFDPNACYGPAPFAPVHYSRWLASQPGTLYVVRTVPAQH